jgi:hypothetical protein
MTEPRRYEDLLDQDLKDSAISTPAWRIATRRCSCWPCAM